MREPALRCLMGEEAALSPSTILRLNARFKTEYEDWTKSSLSSLPIIYVWVDGIYIRAGIADEKACMLVVIGADVTGVEASAGLRRRVSPIEGELAECAAAVESARDERACGGGWRWWFGLLGGGRRSVAASPCSNAAGGTPSEHNGLSGGADPDLSEPVLCSGMT